MAQRDKIKKTRSPRTTSVCFCVIRNLSSKESLRIKFKDVICRSSPPEVFLEKGRNSPPEVFLEKGVLKICSKLTGEHPCLSVISIKLLCNFIEITLRHGCSPVNLLNIFRTSFPEKTSGPQAYNFIKKDSGTSVLLSILQIFCQHFLQNTLEDCF